MNLKNKKLINNKNNNMQKQSKRADIYKDMERMRLVTS